MQQIQQQQQQNQPPPLSSIPAAVGLQQQQQPVFYPAQQPQQLAEKRREPEQERQERAPHQHHHKKHRDRDSSREASPGPAPDRLPELAPVQQKPPQQQQPVVIPVATGPAPVPPVDLRVQLAAFASIHSDYMNRQRHFDEVLKDARVKKTETLEALFGQLPHNANATSVRSIPLENIPAEQARALLAKQRGPNTGAEGPPPPTIYAQIALKPSQRGLRDKMLDELTTAVFQLHAQTPERQWEALLKQAVQQVCVVQTPRVTYSGKSAGKLITDDMAVDALRHLASHEIVLREKSLEKKTALETLETERERLRLATAEALAQCCASGKVTPEQRHHVDVGADKSYDVWINNPAATGPVRKGRLIETLPYREIVQQFVPKAAEEITQRGVRTSEAIRAILAGIFDEIMTKKREAAKAKADAAPAQAKPSLMIMLTRGRREEPDEPEDEDGGGED